MAKQQRDTIEPAEQRGASGLMDWTRKAMAREISAHWNRKDQEWLVTYTREVREKLNHGAMLVLYGSRARGTWNDESDIDILLITDSLTEQEREAWQRRAHELTGTSETMASVLTIDREEWRKMEGWRLWNEIMRDGVLVT